MELKKEIAREAVGISKMQKLKLMIILSSTKAAFFTVNNNRLTLLKIYTNMEKTSINDDRRKTLSGFVKPSSAPSHYFDPHESIKNVERRRFCKKIYYELGRIAKELNIPDIFIYADAKSLGELRKKLEHSTVKKIIIGVPRNLTKFSTKKLEHYIQNRLKRLE